MTTEIPEIFRALLEHQFTLPNFDDNGKWVRNQRVTSCIGVLIRVTCSTVT